MKAVLIHNPNSGVLNGKPAIELAEALEDVGYEITSHTSESLGDLEEILEKTEGMIFIAGGDGSVRAVATRVIGKNIPLVVLPLGTANNISRTLCGDLNAMQIITGLKNPSKRFFDVGRLCSPWGEDFFLESMGIGFYASILKSYKPENGKSIRRGIESILEGLDEYEQPKSFHLTLDDQDISGEYMLVEILNTPTIGPRIRLAPRADTLDGLFDVVRVKESENNGIVRIISSLIKGEVDNLPNVLVNQGKKVEIHWDGFPLHLDDQVLPASEQFNELHKDTQSLLSTATLQVEILPRALEFWVPSENTQEK
jgi:diacylglycerol kinase (ATP)